MIRYFTIAMLILNFEMVWKCNADFEVWNFKISIVLSPLLDQVMIFDDKLNHCCKEDMTWSRSLLTTDICQL
jgi:hypothetical protein